MEDFRNPYAAPTTLDLNPARVEPLGAPSDALRKVASGLALIRNALVLSLCGAVLFTLAYFLVAARHGFREVIEIATSLLGLSIFIAAIMNLLGTLRCLATPRESRARWLIIVAVVAEVLAMLLFVVVERNPLGGWGAHSLQEAILLLLQIGLGSIAFVTFVLFLRKLALFIGRPDLAKRAVGLLVLAGILAAIWLSLNAFAMLVFLGNIRPVVAGGGFFSDLMLGASVTILVLCIWVLLRSVMLLGATKSAILGP